MTARIFFTVYEGNKIVCENVSEADIQAMFGINARISNYCKPGAKLKGKYTVKQITGNEVITDKSICSLRGCIELMQEWDRITRMIKNKVIWVKEPDEKTRKIILGGSRE